MVSFLVEKIHGRRGALREGPRLIAEEPSASAEAREESWAQGKKS